ILATGNTDHWLIEANRAYNNGWTYEPGGGDVENTWGGGIKLVGARDGITGTHHIVQFNDVYWNGYKGEGTDRVLETVNKGMGIWADLVDSGNDPTAGNVVRFNRSHPNADAGLFCEKSRYQKFYYNLS